MACGSPGMMATYRVTTVKSSPPPPPGIASAAFCTAFCRMCIASNTSSIESDATAPNSASRPERMCPARTIDTFSPATREAISGFASIVHTSWSEACASKMREKVWR
eukprot:scaffold24357_cov90-Isochrysis_galbana.AAC.2